MTMLRLSVLVATAVAMAACTSGDDGVDLPGAPASTSVAPTTSAATTTTTMPVVVTTTTTSTTTTTEAPATTAATTSTTAAPVATQPAGPFYRSGDEGGDIAVIQLKLETVGFLDPGYSAGVFDAATNQAVLDFQGQYGLIVDGVVGPETERALTAAALSVNPHS